jgi:hypothetical protein
LNVIASMLSEYSVNMSIANVNKVIADVDKVIASCSL